MGYMKLSLCLALMITMLTFALASRHGEKIHFQDSSELGELDTDERSGNGHGHGHRNHRGRGRHHQHHKEGNVAEFEDNLPLLHPSKGPATPPLILNSHPGRGLGLNKHKFAANQENGPLTNTNLPQQLPAVQAPPLNDQRPIFATQPQPVPPNQQIPYNNNPFLSKLQTPSSVPNTNKSNPNISQGVTNQLPTSDKPATTTPSYLNPRRTDLFYGSNLLEEEANREGKSSDQTEISFIDRGLFDTAPHCKDGQILVNNRCRLAV